MKRFWTLTLLLAIPALLPADKRTNPPTVQKTSPLAVTRGLTTEIKIEGINLVGASSILFEDPAIQGKILHVNTLGGHWTNYAKGAAEGGHKADRAIWRVARSIFVHEDERVARAYGGDDANSPYRFYMKQLYSKLARYKRFAAFKASPDLPDEAVTLDYAIDNLVIRGPVNKVVDEILAMHETIGGFGTLLYCGKDWTDAGLGRKSMELMAEKVMPAVNAALGRNAVAAE